MNKLEGKRIAIAGGRKAEEISKLIKNFGGIPFIRPTQGTVFLEDSKVIASLNRLLHEKLDWIILTTGIGTSKLHTLAVETGNEAEFIDVLKKAKIAARGYKTVNVLKKLGITPTIKDDDGTTEGLTRMFKPYDLEGKHIALQLYGAPAPKMIEWLKKTGANYYEILPYRHIPPTDEKMEQIVSEVLNGDVDVVAFTSGPQIRFMAEYADKKKKLTELIQAFNENVLALSVGKVTEAAIREEGIHRVVTPELERMGSMVVALAEYYEKQNE
ncbi:uroporphyrinogen-III synthase [Chengkuizengella axinellae]|uniref:Uroporphyrinogen-III synthase n=1 Tax=Chengkuizengella axinellae TaxID=3064388 RepID=A0ABT9J1V3_9BACL|nr:uroporphyrinogen-III synthase [Chengkuizengella sp. 2205SS18-9]MDP5275587.1 uroporphyrinogen-III synthase [Chengkuizengella sp. 2205SS18-9]